MEVQRQQVTSPKTQGYLLHSTRRIETEVSDSKAELLTVALYCPQWSPLSTKIDEVWLLALTASLTCFIQMVWIRGGCVVLYTGEEDLSSELLFGFFFWFLFVSFLPLPTA